METKAISYLSDDENSSDYDPWEIEIIEMRSMINDIKFKIDGLVDRIHNERFEREAKERREQKEKEDREKMEEKYKKYE